MTLANSKQKYRNMKTNLRHSILLAIAACTIVLAASNVFGLGSDYPTNESSNPSWPKGMAELVNVTNRVHGFWVNSEDIFFFSGSATNLASFLETYSQIQGIEKHLLVLQDGVGEAKSPWEKTGRSCDWELYGCPRGWLNLGKISSQGTNSVEAIQQAAKDTNYFLEVHFWTGGKIALDQLVIPQNVEVTGGCLKNFESITNGMTRAEVEKRLTMDGGLQGISPVRFIDPSCPAFKINVEFDFKKDAADQGRAIFGKDDKVIRVSKPYLERPFMD
jgi:hypothetical protein